MADNSKSMATRAIVLSVVTDFPDIRNPVGQAAAEGEAYKPQSQSPVPLGG